MWSYHIINLLHTHTHALKIYNNESITTKKQQQQHQSQTSISTKKSLAPFSELWVKAWLMIWESLMAFCRCNIGFCLCRAFLGAFGTTIGGAAFVGVDVAMGVGVDAGIGNGIDVESIRVLQRPAMGSSKQVMLASLYWIWLIRIWSEASLPGVLWDPI